MPEDQALSQDQDRFDAPDQLTRFKYPLPHLAHALRSGSPVKIVAIGSTSTASGGDIVPYPERLEILLRERFPNREIEVVNRQVEGDEAPEGLARLERDVVAERPSLAIWEVGKNAVFHHRDHNLEDVRYSIATGLELFSRLPMDVVLMDPPYVPALLHPDSVQSAQMMVHSITETAASAEVNVFGRFALMRHWHDERMVPFDQLVDPSDPALLYQSDASTEAVAQALSRAIAHAAVRNDNGVAFDDIGDRRSTDELAKSDRSNDAALSPAKKQPWITSSDGNRVNLLFATTRRRSKVPEDFFSGEREVELTNYGKASVHIPQERRLGQVRLPFELSAFSFTLFKQKTNPRKHFILEQCEIIPKDAWLDTVRSSDQKEALVFVHGYNVTFLEGLYRCAQIAWDISYAGIPILFSWASGGLKSGYLYDRDSALDARERFVTLLGDLAEAGVTRVHVLAHSMGNFAVLEALANHDHDKRPLALGEIMMAAPDVDCDHYGKVAPKVRAVTGGMTLYASAVDLAMKASEAAAKKERAGDVPREGPILVDRIDSIDATAVGTDIFGLNHGSYADKKSILNDIMMLLTHGIRPPNKRSAEIKGMPEGETDSKWWRYVK